MTQLRIVIFLLTDGPLSRVIHSDFAVFHPRQIMQARSETGAQRGSASIKR